VVVCVPTRGEAAASLPPARLDDTLSFISGGERSLYELAVAAVVSGFDVELRGDVNEPILTAITDAAGVAPELPREPRWPASGEVVVVPEVFDLIRMAALHLSGAQCVVLALAPPGLFGWSFLSGWTPRDPGEVAPIDVGTPEMFKAIDALGISVWTNAHGTAEAAERAGIRATWVGTGTPVAFPVASVKEFDLAVVEHNRWFESADDVAAKLSDYSVLKIPARPSTYSLCDDLARARVLVWPSRLEGMSRISREARAVGTVPVALDTNPFATEVDHGEGTVLVDDLDDLGRQVRRLLENPDQLAELSARAVAGARRQADWGGFVSRVDSAVRALEPRADAEARAVLGLQFAERLNHLCARVAHLEASEEALTHSVQELEATTKSQADQLALRDEYLKDVTDQLLSAEEHVAALGSELAEFRSRRIVRLLDRIAALGHEPAQRPG